MGDSILSNGLMTIVAAANPTTNYDYQTASIIRKPTGTGSLGEVDWLLYFARPFPLGATITSAKIVLFSGATAQTGTLTLDLRRFKTASSFSKVTWSTRPTTFYATTSSVSKTGPIAANTQWDLDVTAQMQSVSLGDPFYGFTISSTNIQDGLYFYGPTWGTTSLRPRLEVTWSDQPDKPRSLAPSGGRAVTGAKPILRCDYVDTGGDVTMQSIQVQINSTAVFTSPAFDSGTVAASTPELDLSTTAYAGLTDGQVVYWRARVQDGAGLWSEWSDPVDFKRDGPGTLTLTAPSSGTPVVEESTPPITWTFTGETQAAYQITITRSLNGQVDTWTTGKKTSTALTFTLPTGVLTSPDAAYSISLRVWDAKQRESIPNDPAYVEVVRSFTYTPTAAVTGTTALAGAGVTPYPRVALTWNRTTAPDSFTILRDRKVVAAGLLPGPLFVSGTQYTWTDYGASPQTTSLYEVQAVVNGRSSSTNSTASVTLVSQGVWLADASRTNEVMIVGRADRDFTYGETSEVVEVIGGTEVVLVTQALRGIEGSITGELHGGIPGIATTAQQFRDKLLNIKAKAGQRCWLTFGDRTIQCVVRNISVSPRPSATLSFTVKFDFYQVGTLEYVPTL